MSIEMDNIEIVGFTAGTIGTLAFLPQAYKIQKTNNTDGLSEATTLFFIAALALWLTYGVLMDSPSLIATNVFQIIVQMYIYSRIRTNAISSPARQEALGFREGEGSLMNLYSHGESTTD